MALIISEENGIESESNETIIMKAISIIES